MTFLPDVNALVALGHFEHQFHERVTAWIRAEDFPPLLTCSVTEMGFVRVLPQISNRYSVKDAQAILLKLKQRVGRRSITFLSDDHDATHLPKWVRTPKQTTDGHLLALARAHGAVLATLDERIPGAYVIPRIN